MVWFSAISSALLIIFCMFSTFKAQFQVHFLNLINPCYLGLKSFPTNKGHGKRTVFERVFARGTRKWNQMRTAFLTSGRRKVSLFSEFSYIKYIAYVVVRTNIPCAFRALSKQFSVRIRYIFPYAIQTVFRTYKVYFSVRYPNSFPYILGVILLMHFSTI